MQSYKKNAIATTLHILGISFGIIIAIVVLVVFIAAAGGSPQDLVPFTIIGFIFGGIIGTATWFIFRVFAEIIDLLQKVLNNQELILAKLYNQNQSK